MKTEDARATLEQGVTGFKRDMLPDKVDNSIVYLKKTFQIVQI